MGMHHSTVHESNQNISVLRRKRKAICFLKCEWIVFSLYWYLFMKYQNAKFYGRNFKKTLASEDTFIS